MEKIEVYILSGFLGAGKTTLLTNILKQEKEQNRKIAVVMNELGKISIDSNAVPEDTPLKELLNGCVCCTISGQLEAHLQGLIQQHELDAIYIETTGIAHPVEVLDACLSPLFAEKLDMRSIVTLVDALRWNDRSSLSVQLRQLLLEQVKHADTVLLNKSDSLTESQKASVVMELQTLNSSGRILLTEYANIKLSDFQSVKRKKSEEHVVLHAEKSLRMRSYVHTFTCPVDLEKFEEFLRNMPDNIYRIKGYLSFSKSRDMYLFQYSYGTPVYLKEELVIKNTLVFIGENLEVELLKRNLKDLEMTLDS
ncbi:GTP-binding protein [Bacillus lacus]|uniref:GTP-binding protein n=1 Tax=Metabacillus lacus TaxID=1983721 RepID=A0A7X2IY65_9BACI|nr:GTP-binding protein [Metabacillus lacus]MRX71637.1 GTP-binding protein [Metabacillus lacus]